MSIRWFFTRDEFAPEAVSCFSVDLRQTEGRHWPIHVMGGDVLNGTIEGTPRVFASLSDADKVEKAA